MARRAAIPAGPARYRGGVPTLERIQSRLKIFEPRLVPGPENERAAVALVVREHREQAELLFIERATREGDPWSGHMAFPGGRVEEGDLSCRAAAERETLEEVGISLERADYLGALGDLQGHPQFRPTGLVVSAYVFLLRAHGPVVLARSEVRQAMWFPVRDLLSPERHVDYTSPDLLEFKFPGIRVGDPERHVVWGLTYRFLDIFLKAIERPLPDRWGPLGKFDESLG